MRAGELRHLISIRAPSYAQNSLKDSVVTYAEVLKCWSSIEPLSGREYWKAARVQAETTHVIKIRYTSVAIDTTNIIVFGNRAFEIESILNTDERNREIVMSCKEKEGGLSAYT